MVDCKIYPLNPDEQKQLDEFLQEQLETGRIKPSKSPMASPFFFVKKERRKIATSTGLSKTKRNDYKKPIPSTAHFGTGR